MNKFLTSLLLLLLSVTLLAQTADSLFQQYLISTGKTKDNYLIKLAEYYFKDSASLAIYYANEAYENAYRSNMITKGDASLLLAKLYYSNKEFDISKKWSFESLKIFKSLKDLEGQNKAKLALAKNYQEQHSADSALLLINEVIDYAASNELNEWLIDLLQIKVGILFFTSQYGDIEEILLKKLALINEYNDSLLIAETYNDLSTVCRKLGDYSKAVIYSENSMTIYGLLRNEQGLAECYSTLGSIHYFMDDNEQAIGYFLKSLAIFKKLNIVMRVAGMNNNIGSVYVENGDYTKAELYFNEALKLYASLNNKYAEAIISDNLGLVYQGLKQYPKAMSFFEKSLHAQQLIGNVEGEIHAITNIAGLLTEQEFYTKAYTVYKQALQKADSAHLLNEMLFIFDEMVRVEEQLHLYQNALASLRQYVAIKDTMFTQDMKSQLLEMQTKHELQEHQAKFDLLSAENELSQAKVQRQKMYLIWGLIFSVLFLCVLFLALLALRFSRKNKQFLEDRNMQIIEQNKRITDSIRYARRVQSALLKTSNDLAAYFPNSFIISKAQSIVSGDFYWFKKIENSFYLTVADCTGHGVPGAFMSVLGLTLLRDVLKSADTMPVNHLLDELRCKLKVALNQVDLEGATDGMDMALCAIDMETLEMTFSGAYNSVIVVRNQEIFQLKGDKMPIGISRSEQPFTKHTFKLRKGDRLFMFTDGYLDQLTKRTAVKITSKRFKEVLLETSQSSITEQGNLLLNFFYAWMSDNEQTDDMLVLGIEL